MHSSWRTPPQYSLLPIECPLVIFICWIAPSSRCHCTFARNRGYPIGHLAAEAAPKRLSYSRVISTHSSTCSLGDDWRLCESWMESARSPFPARKKRNVWLVQSPTTAGSDSMLSKIYSRRRLASCSGSMVCYIEKSPWPRISKKKKKNNILKIFYYIQILFLL